MDGERELAPGVAARRSTGMHPTIIRRSQNKLSVEVDGRKLYEVAVAADRRFGLGMAVAGRRPKSPTFAPRSPRANRSSTEGIWPAGGAGQHGRLEGRGRRNRAPARRRQLPPQREGLRQLHALVASTRCAKGGNSGIGIRTPRDGWPSGDGMELQILRPAA